MTNEEAIELARQAGIKRRTDVFFSEYCDGICFDDLEAFAKLVAKHTLLNIDPSKFTSWQDGFEVGVQKSRQEFDVLFAEYQKLLGELEAIKKVKQENAGAAATLDEMRRRYDEHFAKALGDKHEN